MSYIGRDIRTGAFRQLDDISSGFDGSDTTHTMQVNSTNVSVGDVNQILLSLGGVIQNPGTDFTVSGSTLTFTTAPAANTSFFAILLGSDNGGTVTPTDGSVTGDKLASNIAITTSGDISFDGGSFVFNESSADKDFRIESNGKANMFFVDGGNDKIGINTTGSTPSQVTIEDVTGNGGGTLGLTTDTSGTSDNLGRLHFGNATDGSLAAMFGIADGANDAGALTFRTEATGAALEEALRIDSNRKLTTNGETAGDTGEGGLCLNQAANDDMIISLKSSDIAHGITGVKQTDTYGFFEKKSATAGGLKIGGLVESASIAGIELFTTVTSEDTDEASGAEGAIQTNSMLKSGTGNQGMQADGNAFVVRVNTTQFIVKADGELFSNQSATVGTFDEYDDAQLVRAYDLSHGKGVINSSFDKFVKYNKDDLKDARLIGKDKDNNPTSFVNVTGFVRLHNGAIWQQYEKHQRLAEAVYEMAKEVLGEDKADAILEKHDIQLLN
jgi:hypothetical protein